MTEKPDPQPDDPKIDRPLASVVGDVRSELDNLRAIFTALGLEPAKGVGVLKYEGEIDGRAVTIVAGVRSRNRYKMTDVVSRRTFQGYSLDIAVGSAAKTRLHFLPSHLTWLHRFTMPRKGNQRLTDLDSLFDHLRVWAHDPPWAQRYLGKPKVQAIMRKFLLGEDGRPVDTTPFAQKLLNAAVPSLIKVKRDTAYTLNYTPESINLAVSNPPAPFTQDLFQGWLDQLFELAKLAEESLPNEAELTSFEQMPSQTRAYILAFSYLFGGMFLLLACCAGPLCLVLALASFATQ